MKDKVIAIKKLKVKDLADKYGVSAKEILKELEQEGFAVKTTSSIIPPDMVDLIDSHFQDYVDKRKKLAAKTAKEEADKAAQAQAPEVAAPGANEIHIKPPIIIKNLATAINKKPNEVITALMMKNVLANINQAIDTDIAVALCKGFGIDLIVEKREKEEHVKHVVHTSEEELPPEEKPFEDKPEDLIIRPPVVTFLGHVDHGKTSLQDTIRKTDVAKGEHGGITQHIGASTVNVNGKAITFIDTPGHEAFTSMRARGANITDIAILVVAADDGFMPQTIEALSHAKAAEVPIIVAVNKIDLPDADPDKILLHMQQNGISPEEWGGDYGVIKVSAKTGAGVDKLLERILLEAEMLELKANPNRPASAFVIEAQLEQGLGPTASILVQNGTLKIGDPILCGEYYGKVKTMIDAKGKVVRSAGPSIPVKLVGLSGVPEAGSKLVVCDNEKEARHIAEEREDKNRNKTLAVSTASSLEDMFSQMDMDKRKTLRVILKTDVMGSTEAIAESLRKLPSEKISVEVIHSGVGSITENDVLLASASRAIVVGFHVRINPGVNAVAKKENVEIRLYSIIYELIQDITDALTGKLDPEKREKELGSAKILKIFELTKGPKICGCMVEKGLVKVGAKARVFRNKELIFNGEVKSLRRFQDDVKEVKQGLECGIKLDNFMDFLEEDLIQIYDIEMKKATL